MIHHRWGVRADIVTEIQRAAGEDGWAAIGRRTIARRAGCSERYVANLLGPKGPLWYVERVVQREPGAGTRPTRWRLNPNVAEWRKVPWTIADPDERARRLLESDLQARYALVARQLAPLLEISGAMDRAASGALSSPLRGPAAGLVARPIAPLDPLSGAKSAPQAPPQWRDESPLVARPIAPLANGSGATPTVLLGFREREGGAVAESRQALAVIEAIDEATGVRLWGPKRAQLVGTVNGLDDAGWIVAEVKRARPVRLGPLAAIQLVTDMVAAGRPATGPQSARKCPICGNATIEGATFCPTCDP
jgi:hypothetical protein